MTDFNDYLNKWGELLEARLKQAHRHVAVRISKQILPQGVWRFPAQALLLPQGPAWQEIAPAETSPVATPLVRKRKSDSGDENEPWTPCGIGWTRSMEALNFSADQNTCRWTLRHTLHEDEPSLFDAKRGLLVFIAAEEAAVAALSSATWRAQIAGSTASVHVERYEGYCEFEKTLRFAATTTPALETWLPPCYPYSRKILHLRFSAPGRVERRDAEAVVISLSVEVEGEIGEALAERMRDKEGIVKDDWLLLNPIPVAQMQMDWRLTDRARRMGNIEILFDNLKGVFAAAGVYGEEWEAVPFVQDGNKTRVDGGKRAVEVRAYFGSRGEIDPADFAASNEEERETRGEVISDTHRKFDILFSPVGGMTSDFANPMSDACRFWWHRICLRSPMLTFSDLQQILGHLPDCKRYFDLGRMQFALEGVNERLREPTHWDTYLWPSRIAEPFLSFESAFRPQNSPSDEAQDLPAEETRTIPISPIIRLTLPVKQGVALPDFLLKDIASHAASYLEQNFTVGWYQIVPEVLR